MQYHILTYGCQMNVYDSGVIGDLLAESGHEPTDRVEDAELILVNTCSIRLSAEQRVHGQLSRLSQLKRSGRCRVLGICGCMAQNHQDGLLARHPYLDLVVGTGALHDLPGLVARLERGEGPQVACALDREREGEAAWPQAFLERPRRRTLPVYVSVQSGCNYNCTFCIVPQVRGPERYRPVDEVLAEVDRLASWGYGEITLIGQTVNAYDWRGVTFPSLLARVAQSTRARIRFATSHPRDFTPELIETIAAFDNLVEYIHLPVQSGSDRMLKRMARRYTAERYLAICRQIRETLGDAPEGCAITSDVIVGFPGETEEDFQQTLRVQDEAGWDGLYSFKYSARPGTAAAQFSDLVPDEVAGERLLRLQERHLTHMKALFRRFEERTVEAVVEAVTEQGYRGRCRTHHIVAFEAPGRRYEIGDIVQIRVEEARPFTLRGTPVNRDVQTGEDAGEGRHAGIVEGVVGG